MPQNIIVKLADIGLKVTPQRRAILKYLEGNTTHPSADVIYKALMKDCPNLSFATVYNTLSKLVAKREIRMLDVDPGKRRFDPSMESHGHFYCTECGSISDIDLDDQHSGKGISHAIKDVYGHEVEEFQVSYKGICKSCVRA
jgi:Fur family transcriptional regulator, peroxide stress response regulator